MAQVDFGCSASAGTVAVCHKLSRRAVSKPLRNARNKWSCCARHDPDHRSWETSTAKKKILSQAQAQARDQASEDISKELILPRQAVDMMSNPGGTSVGENP